MSDFADAPGLLVMFICNHCPYVIHYREQLARFHRDYRDQGLAVVAICSNDVDNYPQDGPDKMKLEAATHGYEFPYLFDGTQEVAKAYTAACTPDFFLFGPDHTLAYRGRLDASRPGNDEPITGGDLRDAADMVLAGKAVPKPHPVSAGCNIKWKPGNAPEYYG